MNSRTIYCHNGSIISHNTVKSFKREGTGLGQILGVNNNFGTGLGQYWSISYSFELLPSNLLEKLIIKLTDPKKQNEKKFQFFFLQIPYLYLTPLLPTIKFILLAYPNRFTYFLLLFVLVDFSHSLAWKHKKYDLYEI